MPADEQTIRRLVERELSRRLSASALPPHPALAELSGPFMDDDACETPESSAGPGSKGRPCVIEPSAPCYNSGYCKKLGH